jgi:hypothetical protein
MKIKAILCAALTCAPLAAVPLGVPTAVQSQPDPSSPVIAVLAAGTEQPAPSQKAGPAPAGWIAVDVSGPFTGYVKNRDLTKQLDVVPGAPIYIAPKDGAGVLEVYAKGDNAVITGLHGGWTQVRLEKALVGYILTGAPAAAPMTSVPVDAAAAAPAPVAQPSAAPAASGAPASAGEAPALSQLFEGTLASSHTLLAPRRPFKWELVDASGKRIAYLDLKDLLLTEQIESYVGHQVVVLGSLRPVKETRDIVIDVESFHLR